MCKREGAYVPRNRCFDGNLWYGSLSRRDLWSRYSQRWQDSILASLFLETNLGTTNKRYVEFGFSEKHGYDGIYAYAMRGSNTKMLHDDFNWVGVLFDAEHEHAGSSLYKELVTPEDVCNVFQKYDVPREPDFVSIDIDSCDIWVFLEMTKCYRPRVVALEYNSAFSFEESVAVRCKLPTGERFSFSGADNLFGASLQAMHKAAKSAGYSIVYALPMDVIMVRNDLLCTSGVIDISTFRNSTNVVMFPADAAIPDVPKWLITF
eukprot:TRINITY_DN57131_c0_g1_i1.p1 TRINITY_DN57131_c0_g1~~TRINITY_DN57131_c0_g1_i1.p1  ORF type:complete len:263 (-),score=29.43 TRINITY_DN57131_c0_g1_i1:218-1006(-)